MIDELHAQHFKVVLHIVIEGRRLTGTVDDPCTPAKAVPSGRTPDDRWPDDRSGRLLLAVPQAALRSRHRRLVARSGRRPRRAVAPGAHPHVLGRLAAVAAERAAVCAASQRLRRACSATARFSGRATCTRRGRRCKTHVPVAINTGLSGIPYLGHRHRRLRSDGRVHRRAARALVPVRRVLPVVPRARPQLAPAAAVGLEQRRGWSDRRSRGYRGGAANPDPRS